MFILLINQLIRINIVIILIIWSLVVLVVAFIPVQGNW